VYGVAMALVRFIVTPDKLAAVAKSDRPHDLLTDPRFSDPAKLVETAPQYGDPRRGLRLEPMAHWYESPMAPRYVCACGAAGGINDPQHGRK